MDIIKLLNTAGGIIGALGVITAAIFGALYGRKRAEKDQDNNTINSYERNSDALKKLLETRERELGEAKILHDENQKRIEILEQKSNILENQVTQAPSITKLTLQIGKQHNEMMKQMSNMTNELGNIAKAMQKG